MDDHGLDLEEEYATKELEELSFPYELLGEGTDGVLITGVALTEGVWKNVIYSAKEIKKVAANLVGKPLLIEHGRTKEFGDREVGKVTKSYFEEALRGIVFQALVTDALAKRLVKKGILPAVSCSTWMDKRAINDQIRIGADYNFAELSLVRVPACDRCFIFHKEQLSLWKSKEKDLKDTKEKETNQGETRLEEEFEDTEFEDFPQEEEEQLSKPEELEAPKLFAVLELPDEESLASLKNAKKVVSYYYGKKGKGYYPYYGKYPEKKSFADEPVLLAVVECSSREELEELRQTFNLKKAYYGYCGYPEAQQFAGPTTYQYKYKYRYPKRLSAEDLSDYGADLKAVLKEFTSPREPGDTVLPSGTPMPQQTGAPNPEQCQKVTCPVDDKEFPDETAFMEHWKKEHAEQYGEFKETMTILDALSQVVDLAKGETKIVKMKNGRFMAMVDTGKTGFGQWKILGNFATKDEAEAAFKGKGKEEKAAEEEKDKFGCIVGKEKWDEKEKKCVPVSEEEMSEYTEFMKSCMAGKEKDLPDIKARMKACAAEWGKKGQKPEAKPEEKPEAKPEEEPEEEPEEKQEEIVCPACKKKFPSEKDLGEHWAKEHQGKYGPLKGAYKYPEKKSGRYFYFVHNGKYYPYYYKDGKYYKKEEKPKK